MMDFMNQRKISRHREGGLDDLRTACAAGYLGFREFLLAAARHYLANDKPWRAKAMLTALMAGTNSSRNLETSGLLQQAHREIAQIERPTCSLNMIVKNESHNIDAALGCVDECVDEIVIGDTGSQDDTAARARMYGATVVPITWQNDFAHARNLVIDASACNWILWMDADDRLSADSARKIRQAWMLLPPSVVAFRIVNEACAGFGSAFMQYRLVARREDVRFERPIHEHIAPSAHRAGLPARQHADISIVHTGYRNLDEHMRKARRNLPIIRKAVVSHSDDWSLKLSLGECYTILGRNEEALGEFTQIADNREVWNSYRDTYLQAHYYAGLLCKESGKKKQAIAYLTRCCSLAKSRCDASYLLGKLYYDGGDEHKAFNAFLAAASTPQQCLHIAAVDGKRIQAESLYHLGRILIEWEKWNEAHELLTRAIAAYPDVVEFYAQMGKVCFCGGRFVDALEYYRTSRKLSPRHNPEAYANIARIQLVQGNLADAIETLVEALEHESAAPDIYMLLGDITFAQRRPHLALASFEKALGSGPVDKTHAPQLWKAISSALDAQEPQSARRFLQKILQVEPQNADAQEVSRKLEIEAMAA
ncbi:MAG: tetratricopeptide repeat protein [Chitinivibrionales bacterium]|nr:tetratricopeptide repeat protein [Chitinivibrionales bacterium]